MRARRALGAFAEAIEEATEAVALLRALVAVDPGGFMPLLGKALYELAGAQAANGRQAESLAAATEAIDLQRRLFAKTRQAFIANIAQSLHEVAQICAAAGPREGRGRGGDRSNGFVRRAGLGLPPRRLRTSSRSAGAVAPRLELVLQVQEPAATAYRWRETRSSLNEPRNPCDQIFAIPGNFTASVTSLVLSPSLYRPILSSTWPLNQIGR